MTSEAFFVEVLFRNQETIQNVLLENVEIGTTIIIDCWTSYINLNEF
ncbi:hypothetical protein H312_01736 [Anncaliia algerae PRA339]|uniref:ISXO2-like transposase domain-containing protein n=1 Tax=Anncaliia algerae PRA339 TaxID=1288291 RepID=A0A059F0M5_9MICR|nr:hypothetical protein H312_01736 [Anncaliia algerae PRA339]